MQLIMLNLVTSRLSVLLFALSRCGPILGHISLYRCLNICINISIGIFALNFSFHLTSCCVFLFFCLNHGWMTVMVNTITFSVPVLSIFIGGKRKLCR